MLEVVFADGDLLVAAKPAGLLSVPGKGVEKQDCFVTRIQSTFSNALTVHRLDMATSGLMVFARGVVMQRALSLLFSNRSVHKRYVAVVYGHIDTSGEIDLPIITDWPNRPRQKVDHSLGKPSLTLFHRLDYDAVSDVSRVALTPITGRTHQLRLHLASVGHPIVGDRLYNGSPHPRLLLHADQLVFPHPKTGETLHFEHPAPF